MLDRRGTGLRDAGWGRGPNRQRDRRSTGSCQFTTFICRGTYYAPPAMLSLRAIGAVFLLSLFNFKLTTCRSPGEGGSEPTPSHADAARDVTLPGVDSSSLTGREKSDWSRVVS